VRFVRRAPWYAVPLGIFLLTRLVDGLALILLAPHDSYGHTIAYWDGGWYRQIAEHGYPSHLPVRHGVVQQSGWAFYPAYPALVRVCLATGLSYGVAASVVSLGCGAGAMCLMYRMLMPATGRFGAGLAVLALCTYPAAVVFQAAYAESLTLLLILGCLWCLRERRYAALLALALVLALTRPVVLPLAIVVGLHWLARWKGRDDDPFPGREAVGLAATAGLTAASFLLWPAIAALRTGRANAYFETAQAWYPARERGWPSWLVVIVNGQRPGLAVIAALAALAMAAVVARRATSLWGPELRCWAAAYSLYLLASTRPTTSIVRYAMLAIVPWWPVPEIGRAVTSARGRAALALVVACLGVASQVVWMHWFFVRTPAWRSYP
jgi:hypothetical protein